ncbi:MAG: hypothetical protein HC828_08815 [Blastochloris sp.]|nr:hypothetical protein [Blastochloris sp.]
MTNLSIRLAAEGRAHARRDLAHPPLDRVARRAVLEVARARHDARHARVMRVRGRLDLAARHHARKGVYI